MKKPAARVLATAFVLLVGVAGSLVAAQPALADSYYACAAYFKDVTAGTSNPSEAITCVQHPVCGETWGEGFYVTWDAQVYSDRVYVRGVTLRVSHPQHEDVVVGAKWFEAASNVYLSGWNTYLGDLTEESKYINITDQNLYKRSDNTVEFDFYTSATKDNGCGTGWQRLRFVLHIV